MTPAPRRLKFCVSRPIKSGIGARAEHDDPDWPRYVRITDIKDARTLRDDTFRSLPPEIAAEASFGVGDILAAAVGATFGKTYLHTVSTGPVAFAGYLVRISPSQEFDARFVAYWTESHDYWNQVNSNVIQATIQNFSAAKFSELEIPVPARDAQILISDYLDRETTRIDGLIAEKERMLALLAEKRAALISRVVTRGLDPNVPLKSSGQEWLGEIPAHWGVERLKYLAEVRGGLTLGKQYSGELLEYPYLRVANVQDGYLKLDDVLTVEVPASEAAANLLAYGDVLMNEGGDIDKLGRGCVWRDEIAPCLHQNHVFSVRPHSVDSDWLALWTSTLQAKYYFESRAKRSTNLASISGSNIKELPVPLPPVSEQLAIQNFLAVRHSRLETLRGQLRDSLRLLTERRAALITAAVTGQIPLEEMDVKAPEACKEAAL